ncbi:MAG: hypothetical protein KJO26_04240 [Deltaproteobacteria bacterium]|nr:hypothetical protein [Deltaproteobacteria bacterium]NNK86158.1 hypothetical protein [Desulfobacterales bacterium]
MDNRIISRLVVVNSDKAYELFSSEPVWFQRVQGTKDSRVQEIIRNQTLSASGGLTPLLQLI